MLNSSVIWGTHTWLEMVIKDVVKYCQHSILFTSMTLDLQVYHKLSLNYHAGMNNHLLNKK